jgi:hypothetical protein
MLVRVQHGAVVEFPAGTAPCAMCGMSDAPVALRGWARVYGFVLGARETRSSAYVCAECGRTETMKSLLVTAVLGWLSIPSFLFYGWRATFHNWRSAWTVPLNPLLWGAIPAAEFKSEVRAVFEDYEDEVADEAFIRNSPLASLSPEDQARVLRAEDLYATLEVSSAATGAEIRRAFHDRAKQVHPDTSHGGSGATEAMIRVNEAWEILRSPQSRAAYDWLQAQGVTGAA